jgi:hypothetical protein
MPIYLWVHVMTGFGRKYLRQVHFIHCDLETTLVFEGWSACKHSQFCNPHMSLLWAVVAAITSTRVHGDLAQMFAPFPFLLPSLKSTFKEYRTTGAVFQAANPNIKETCYGLLYATLLFSPQLLSTLKPLKLSHPLTNFFHPSPNCSTYVPKHFSTISRPPSAAVFQPLKYSLWRKISSSL